MLYVSWEKKIIKFKEITTKKKISLSMQSCTKVAVDFVSPENIMECLRLTEEFRQLPMNHRAREDKLEVTSFLKHILHGLHFHNLASMSNVVFFFPFINV
jgi:hypothetical protein